MKRKKSDYNGKKNLISLADRSLEERKAISAKAAAARKVNAARRKTIKEISDQILSLEGAGLASVLDNKELQQKAGEMDLSVYDIMYLKMIDQSLKGSVKAFEAVRDSAGDKPVNKSEADINIINQGDNLLLNKIADRLGINTDQVIEGSYTEL